MASAYNRWCIGMGITWNALLYRTRECSRFSGYFPNLVSPSCTREPRSTDSSSKVRPISFTGVMVLCISQREPSPPGSLTGKVSFMLPFSQNHSLICPSGSFPGFFTRMPGLRNCVVQHMVSAPICCLHT